MNLAFCLFHYFPYGGLQRDFLRIAEACINRGHQVTAFAGTATEAEQLSFPLHILPVHGWQNHSRIRAYLQQLQHLNLAKNYDLVLGFNKMPGLDIYYAADVCYQARIMEQRGFLYRLTPRYRYLHALEQAVFAKQMSTQILYISPPQKTIFQHYYATEEQRFHFLPPGISTDRIAPHNAREIRQQFRVKHGISHEQQILLMIGSGFKTKGVDRAIYAFHALSANLKTLSQLWIVGADNAQPYRKLARKLGIQHYIQFLGPRNDIPELLLAADVLLHPAYHENTGTVLLEALVAGLPVITTDVCGYAQYIQTANAGFVVPTPFNQLELNQKLINLYNPLLRRNFRAHALTFAQHADIYAMPTRAAEIIESIGMTKHAT